MRTRTAITAALNVTMIAAASCGGTSTRSRGGGVTATTNQTTARASGTTPFHPQVQIRAGENPRDVVVAAAKIWVVDLGEETVREFDTQGRQLRTVKLDSQSIAPGPNSLWLGELSNSNTGPQAAGRGRCR